jgi:hypothetical protein
MNELSREETMLSKATALECTAAKVRRICMKPWGEDVGVNVGRCSQLVIEMLALVMEGERTVEGEVRAETH